MEADAPAIDPEAAEGGSTVPDGSRPAGFGWRETPWLTGIVVALLAVSVVMRLLWLNRMPGVNADETELAVRAIRLLHGEPVGWLTPNGNVLNPFLVVPHMLVALVARPSFWALRLPMAVINLVALAVIAVDVRRRRDGVEAAVALLLAACLPTCLAYSRFCWDTSESLLACWLVLALALRRRWIACGVALAAAVLVHPTNLLAVLYIGPFLAWGIWCRQRGNPRQLAWLGGGLAGVAVVVAGVVAWRFPEHVRDACGHLGARLTAVGDWGWVAVMTGRLFSGTTVYRYIVGSGSGPMASWADHLVLVALVGLATGGTWLLWRRGRVDEAWVAIGTVATVVALYLLKGLTPFLPATERYAVVLLAPVILVTSAVMRQLKEPRSAVAVACGLGALGLVSFGYFYFYQLSVYNSSTERTFLTGLVEPKQAAYERIRKDWRGRGGPAVIYADTYWLEVPLRYLASNEAELTVQPETAFEPPVAGGPAVYVVTFGRRPEGGAARDYLAAHPVEPWQITDAQGRVTISVYVLPPAQSR